MFLYLAIAIPFLFLIGTIYSAIKEQRRLERTTLQDVLSKKQKKRLGQYKKHIKELKLEKNERSLFEEDEEDLALDKDLDSKPIDTHKKNTERKHNFNVIDSSVRDFNTPLLDQDLVKKDKDKKDLDKKDNKDSKENTEELSDAAVLLDFKSYDKSSKEILSKVDNLLKEIDK